MLYSYVGACRLMEVCLELVTCSECQPKELVLKCTQTTDLCLGYNHQKLHNLGTQSQDYNFDFGRDTKCFFSKNGKSPKGNSTHNNKPHKKVFNCQKRNKHCAKVFDSCLMMKKVHQHHYYILVYHGLRAKKGRVCSHERPKGNNSFLMAFGIRLLNCHYDCEIGAKQQCFQL